MVYHSSGSKSVSFITLTRPASEERRRISQKEEVVKRNPQRAHLASTPQRSPNPIVQFPPRAAPLPPPPNPESCSAKKLHNQRDLWVIRKSRTNLPHQEEAGHLPALGNLYVNSGRSAVFLVHQAWSPARSQAKRWFLGPSSANRTVLLETKTRSEVPGFQ